METKRDDLAKPEEKTPAGAEARPEHHTVYLSWEAEEYEHIPKKRWWFAALGLITFLLAGGAIYLENYFFSVFIIGSGITLALFARRRPEKVRFSITSEGLEIGHRLHAFENLSSFWIFFDPPLFKELSVESKKMFMPRLRLPLGDVSQEAVRGALSQFLPEEKQEESFIALLARIVGF